MRTIIAVLVAGAVGVLSGCSSARYVQRNGDGGIVAVADGTNTWPTYNRDKAIELIVQHVGPSYEIVKEEEVVTGQMTLSDRHANQVVSSEYTEDMKAWYIHYRRSANPSPGQLTQQVGPDGLIRIGVDFNTTQPTGAVVQTGATGKPPLPSLLPLK